MFDRAAQMLETVLVDRVMLYRYGAPNTYGYDVTRVLSVVDGKEIPALVQTTVLENAVESQVQSTYSVKLPAKTMVTPGMVVSIRRCEREPSLEGHRLMLDKVSQNGLALIRKCVASDFHEVNQEGKGDLRGRW